MRNPFKQKQKRGLDYNIPASLIAKANLESYKLQLETDPNVRQVKLNVISDRLRKYLGESSKVYQSFAVIDISITDSEKAQRIRNAAELIGEAIYIIESDGIYEDLNTTLIRENIKESKRKTRYAALGAIGGALLTNAKDIVHQVLVWLHIA